MEARVAEVAEERSMAGERAEALAERFERVLVEHGAALRRVAASYEARPGPREDLFQEIGLALWQALPRFRGECSERTFVFRIAHNRGLSHCWRRKAEPGPMSEAEEPADPGPGPEAAAEAAQRRERLMQAVRALPLSLRQAVALTLEGLSQKEVAEVLEITENNVAVRLSRARDALRGALGAGAGGER
jgi:RNA polymerase sigma-70 factor (ECF subfamily)